MFDGLLLGLNVASTPMNLLACLIGTIVGTAIGVLPGLGPVATISILMPITYYLEPTSAIIMLSGIFFGTMYGGSITSILVNVPGEANSIVTCIDGHQMARRGRAGAALGISAFGSFAGGLFAVVGLCVLGPILPRLAQSFGPPEYVMLVLVGLLLVTQVGQTGRLKGLIMAGTGLFLATMGTDPITAEPRYTFGQPFLMDGVGIVPLAIGMFGVGELLALASARPLSISDQYKSFGLRDLLPTRAEWRRSAPSMARGSVIGFFLGLLPGGGMTLVSFTSYVAEKRFAPKGTEFGRGAIEGVAGPETANNAGSQAAFAPMLTLGLPSNGTMGVIMGALMVHGVAVGPQLITTHPDIFWGVIASMIVANLMLLILNVPLISIFVRLLKVPYPILVPMIMLLVIVGAYTINNQLEDVWLTLIFGLMGFGLRRAGYDPAPLILAYVLGLVLERSFRQSLILGDDLSIFIDRPISAFLLACAMLILVVPMFSSGIRTVRRLAGDRAAA